MELKPGYKHTAVGVIPDDWDEKPLHEGIKLLSGHHVLAQHCNTYGKGTPYITGPADFHDGIIRNSKFTEKSTTICRKDDILVTVKGSGAGTIVLADSEYCISRQLMAVRVIDWDTAYVHASLRQDASLFGAAATGLIPGLSRGDILNKHVPIPPLPEQRAIAGALSDVDVLLGALDRLIAKKRDLKQAAMQQLLTGQTRLPGFHSEWEVKTLQESTDCLDGVRVPLNETQRAQMKGDYPYCGANGVLDYVNGYVIDDDIILIAEDGGYFDEYEHRPIAYRMSGKCWVNNHAHILKAKLGFDQGFIFYSLVHKNILPFLASGTRAKLNKSEMNKIEVRLPKEQPEQTAIAEVLTEMDAELAALEQRRDKTRALKQGMMQELLTGRTRLV
jgi:type I restriction enzyme S subunit